MLSLEPLVVWLVGVVVHSPPHPSILCHRLLFGAAFAFFRCFCLPTVAFALGDLIVAFVWFLCSPSDSFPFPSFFSLVFAVFPSSSFWTLRLKRGHKRGAGLEIGTWVITYCRSQGLGRGPIICSSFVDVGQSLVGHSQSLELVCDRPPSLVLFLPLNFDCVVYGLVLGGTFLGNERMSFHMVAPFLQFGWPFLRDMFFFSQDVYMESEGPRSDPKSVQRVYPSPWTVGNLGRVYMQYIPMHTLSVCFSMNWDGLVLATPWVGDSSVRIAGWVKSSEKQKRDHLHFWEEQRLLKSMVMAMARLISRWFRALF